MSGGNNHRHTLVICTLGTVNTFDTVSTIGNISTSNKIKLTNKVGCYFVENNLSYKAQLFENRMFVCQYLLVVTKASIVAFFLPCCSLWTFIPERFHSLASHLSQCIFLNYPNK